MHNFLKRLSRNTAGFSLIEIMAALTILGIVVGLVAVNVTGSLTKAKVQSAKIAINTLTAALEEYRRDCHKYPSTAEGLGVLIQNTTQCRNYKPGGYLAKSVMPRDPWDREFLYYSPAQKTPGKFEIISLGADGAEGGEGEDADLNSNTLEVN